MKKSLIFVGMLSIGFAYAQKGNVGINSNKPKATLDIQPNADNARVDATTNQGILAPRLSKVRVANIKTPVEGTLVYVLDENSAEYPNALISAYTAGTNTTVDNRVAKITEKGYYFYNGTEWVKTSAGANGELWAQRDNGGVTETYLKPANINSDFIGYKNGGKWSLNIGNVNESEFNWDPTTKGFSSLEIPVSLAISSDRLPLKTTIGGGNYFIFSNDSYLLKNEHTSKNPNASYVGNEQRFLLKDAEGADIEAIIANSGSSDIYSNSNIKSVIGVSGLTGVGTDVYNKAKAQNNIAGNFIARNYGTSDNMYGGSFGIENGGIAKNINGIITRAFSHRTDNTSHTVENIKGIENHISLKSNGTLKSSLYGQMNRIDITENTTIEENALVRGISSDIYVDKTTGLKNIINYVSSFHPKNVSIDLYEDFTAYPNLGDNTNLKEYVGFGFAVGNINENASVEKIYGLKIADITKGTVNNFAIHTGAGQVRVGDLAQSGAGDRVVYADENGVLKTGGSIASNNGVQNETSMTCTAENAGKINYTTIQQDGKDVGVFGFCMQKGTDYVWAYMLGGSNIYGTSDNGAVFGQGLQ